MSSRRSRMSLGGGALRRGTPLVDSSSRYNVRSSLSASDDEHHHNTPQKLYSSNSQRSSSVSRRKSFGGDGLLSRSNFHITATGSGTPIRDRRAMLEKWRQSRSGGGGNSTTTATANGPDDESVEKM